MLKKFFAIILANFLLWVCFWDYTSDVSWRAEVEKSKEYVKEHIKTQNIWYIEQTLERFRLANIRYQFDEKLHYALSEIKNTIKEELDARESKIKDKKSFFNEYWKNITSDVNNVPTKCTKHYDLVDEIAKERDFPTGLIIATWFRESNCRMQNPKNLHWPFQITSHNYEPWEISKQQFKEKVNEFVDFMEAKQEYYHTNPRLREIYWEREITTNYKNFDIRSLRLSAVLYNWLTPNNTPDNSYYANWNLNEDFEDASRDGVITMFLKVLNWESNNL